MTEAEPKSTARRRPTIVDVAQRAGVSTATASKVLRKESYGVSDKARARVELAMSELEYRPLASARGMRGKTFTIGVVTPDVSNPFFSMIVDGLVGALESSSYELMIGRAGADVASHQRVIDAMLDRQMDGLLIISPKVSQERLTQAARIAPTVVLGRHGQVKDFDTIVGDDYLGASQVVDHLVALGHRNITYIANQELGGDPDWPQPIFRESGYRDAMTRHGLEANIDVVGGDWTDNGGRAVAQMLMQRPELPTAIFAGADLVAFGVLHELWEHGHRVPETISVVGYDNTPMADLAPLGLTSVDQQGVKMGAAAGEMLLERFNGRTESVFRTMDAHLVTRTSSAPPRQS